MARHHAIHAGDVSHIVNDINNLEPAEAERLYGFEFREGSAVYDLTYNKIFNSVSEWAEFNVQQDELEYEEDINKFKSDYPGYN